MDTKNTKTYGIISNASKLRISYILSNILTTKLSYLLVCIYLVCSDAWFITSKSPVKSKKKP
jgi:hypothetical protein